MTYFYASDCDGQPGDSVLTDEIGTGVVISGTGIAQYSSTQKITEVTSIFFDPSTAFKIATYTFPAAPDEVYMRLYLYIDSTNPSGNTVFAKIRNSATAAIVGQLSFTTAGNIRVARGATSVWASVNAYLDQWVRIEWRCNGGADQELRIYAGANLNGTVVPSETSGVVGADNEAVMSDFAFGGIAVSSGANFYIDDVALADAATGWIGPIVPLPTASFLVSDTSVDVFTQVDFDDNSSGTIDSWFWDFGDGATSSEQNPSHIYEAEGVYTVMLTVANTTGESTTSQTVTVSALTTTVLYASSFENGNVGEVVLAGNEALDAVNGTPVYSDVKKITGTKSMLVDGITTDYCKKLISPAQTQICFRGYFQFKTFPLTRTVGLAVFRTSSTTRAGVFIDKYGVPQIRSGSANGKVLVKGLEALDKSVWHRIEIRLNPTTCVVRIWSGATRHATTDAPIRLSYTAPSESPFASTDEVRFGATNAIEGAEYYVEDVAIQTDWVGPVAGSTEILGAAFRSPVVTKTGKSNSFTDFSSGSPISWDWDFGDGTAHSTEQNPSHTFATAGLKTVTLTVTDGLGGSKSVTKEITVIDVAAAAAILKVRDAAVWKTGARVEAEGGVKGKVRVYKASASRWTGNATPPTTSERFPGDPGNGKIYIGGFPQYSNFTRYDEEFGATGFMKDITYAGGPSVPLVRTPGLFRDFQDWNSLNQTTINNAIARGAIPWVSWKLQGGATQLANAVNGDHDAWIKSVATFMKSKPNRWFWLTINHEADQGDGFMSARPRASINDYAGAPNRDDRSNFRKLQRRFVNILRSEGAANFAFIPVVYMQYTFLNGVRDPWWEWWPDWKGDATYPTEPTLDNRSGITGLAAGYQGGFLTPNASDFWIKSSDGDLAVSDMVGLDLYCYHCKGGTTAVNPADNLWAWSNTTYYSHDIYANDSVGARSHFAQLYDAFDYLYGTAMPFAIGEMGYAFRETEDPANPGKPLVNETVTKTHWDAMYQDCLDRRIVGLVFWRTVMNNRSELHWCSVDNTINTLNYDTTDQRRKVTVQWLDKSNTVRPPW